MLQRPTAPLDCCHHPLVRDLAWVVLAPDLIATRWQGRPTREQLGLADDARFRDFLLALEANPEPLERRVGNTVNGRMGLYHERLWQFLLDTAPATQLLAHNLRVQSGKQTLGELDLLYRRREDPAHIHLEVAIKFYLGLPEGPGGDTHQARWIGPGGADSLASKRHRLHHHQLRLTERPETRQALFELLGSDAVGADRPLVIHPQLAMPGVLFYPWRFHLPAPLDACHTHLRGTWLFWRQWRSYRDGLAAGTRGAWLTKPHWLALPRPERLLALRELEARLAEHFRKPASPTQLALWHAERGWRRLFVVADDWPRQIPLPPYT
ncbi:DUF1853 family protein [Halomonas campisalis]|uniref:DUF1853 family protein n=1 Tax=Billgrantia campisalis TaxID=74661 RepID=A0ABS9P6I6_9GAMM|nr:DUF1853 family protein [Halomonas campisalis]MCG6657206.1 DUF1853 family protein [Halomonas campisalis]MDR5862391.1 DUF1853 family protein [Halomonas campisalis]